ncbi:hypothetical protein [Candidatus Protochlamydia sp. W-9]|uniref:hypothetical protein n=1 Tax=Candidatus Protochlamydia sp. W-9 TaxID=1785087 RepID=UPI00096A7C5C|nr:hypothetical protein [Candidatus Protochlamydia sp. W-9]
MDNKRCSSAKLIDLTIKKRYKKQIVFIKKGFKITLAEIKAKPLFKVIGSSLLYKLNEAVSLNLTQYLALSFL